MALNFDQHVSLSVCSIVFATMDTSHIILKWCVSCYLVECCLLYCWLAILFIILTFICVQYPISLEPTEFRSAVRVRCVASFLCITYFSKKHNGHYVNPYVERRSISSIRYEFNTNIKKHEKIGAIIFSICECGGGACEEEESLQGAVNWENEIYQCQRVDQVIKLSSLPGEKETKRPAVFQTLFSPTVDSHTSSFHSLSLSFSFA